MPGEIPIQKGFDGRHLLAVRLKQFVRASINPKVPVDSFALDIRVVSFKINDRVGKVFYGDAYPQNAPVQAEKVFCKRER